MENISGLEAIPSPSLLISPELVETNITRMLEAVNGKSGLLRPHVKTHKLGEVIQLQQKHGIDKVKCATPAEMEMAAKAGVADALLAYQPVGPNIKRLLQLRKDYPKTRFSAVVDCPEIAECISRRIEDDGDEPLTLFIDLDTGMHRTGIASGDGAVLLSKLIDDDEFLEFGGIHAYDGHIHQSDVTGRRAAFLKSLEVVHDFVDNLSRAGVEIPVVVAGGSPTFAMHAEFAQESAIPWECSPGTTLLWDAGYGTNHPDLEFETAAGLLTRVISKPQAGHICLDLGHKSVAGENPISNRVRFAAIPDASFVSQSEEHLVVATDTADQWKVGDTLIGIPWHICPSLALHGRAFLVENNAATGETWTIHARDRQLGSD